MRVLLRNTRTELFLAEEGKWTTDKELARELGSGFRVLRFVIEVPKMQTVLMRTALISATAFAGFIIALAAPDTAGLRGGVTAPDEFNAGYLAGLRAVGGQGAVAV